MEPGEPRVIELKDDGKEEECEGDFCPYCGGYKTEQPTNQELIPRWIPLETYPELPKPTLHMIGLFHTVTSNRWSHCAFTGKVLRFSKMMKMYGWKVIEYSNGVSESEADEKVMIMTEDELMSMITKKRENEKDFVGNDAQKGSLWWMRFDGLLKKEMMKRVKDGDIICHPLGDCHKDLTTMFPKAYHVETGIGYPETFLQFRIFESSCWMHHHLSKDKSGGKNYNWVVPNYYDLDEWDVGLEPDNYVVFLGRIDPCKGMHQIVEIALRTKRKVVICGQGDPDPWLRSCPQLVYKPPIHGRERNELLKNAYCALMASTFIEPFGGAGAEAMLCGTPLLAVNYGAFQETVVHGVTGFLCNTLGDWLDGIKAVKTLDRKKVAEVARSRFSLEAVGKKYDIIFRQISDLRAKGWYNTRSFALQGEIARNLPEEDDQVSTIKLYVPPYTPKPAPPPKEETPKQESKPITFGKFIKINTKDMMKDFKKN